MKNTIWTPSGGIAAPLSACREINAPDAAGFLFVRKAPKGAHTEVCNPFGNTADGRKDKRDGAFISQQTLNASILSFVRRSVIAVAAAAALFPLTSGQAAAVRSGGSIAGSWIGGGWVAFAGRAKERARCRVRYTAQSATRFSVSARCATESGIISQTAMVRKAGANSYAGRFYNAEYSISGSIYITVRGNSQTATLRSSNGAAVLSLSR